MATAAATDPTQVFWVGEWRVDPLRLRLTRGREEVRVEHRVMALLLCLAESGGRPVPREDLHERVWAGVIVGDDAINRAVSKLRRALGEDRGGPPTIETVPKVGYRLVVPVRRDGSAAAATPAVSASRDSEPDTGGNLPERATTAAPAPSWRRGWAWGALLLLVLAAGLWGAGRGLRPAPGLGPVTVRPLTSSPGIEAQPAFSPDGERVAFTSRRPEGGNRDVYVQPVGSGSPRRLTHHPGTDGYPAWSPDGRSLAFVRRHEGRCALLQVPADGGVERHLGACHEPMGLDWSPDGRLLIYPDRPHAEAPYRIVSLSLAGGATRTVTSPAAGTVGDVAAAFAPGGEVLAFLRSPVLGVEDVYLTGLSGGTPRRLTHDSLKVHGLDWTADGRHLVFASNRGGLFSLWMVPASGGEPRWLGVGGGDVEAPSAAGKRGRIASELWREDTNVYRLDLTAGGAPVRLAAANRWDWHPAVSPDGTRLAFLSDRSGSSEVWLASVDGDEPRQVTALGGPYVTGLAWAPDGDRLALEARPGGNADIFLLEPAVGTLRRLAAGPAEEVAPSWSPDGRWLYFGSNRGGAWRIWKLPLDGGAPRPVTGPGGFRALAAADGSLYFSRRGQSGIWRLAAEGGPEQLVVPDLLPVDRANWTLTGDALLYVRRPRPDRPRLARLDLASGRVEDLAALPGLLYKSGLAATPDGTAAFFTRIDEEECDILVIETDG